MACQVWQWRVWLWSCCEAGHPGNAPQGVRTQSKETSSLCPWLRPHRPQGRNGELIRRAHIYTSYLLSSLYKTVSRLNITVCESCVLWWETRGSASPRRSRILLIWGGFSLSSCLLASAWWLISIGVCWRHMVGSLTVCQCQVCTDWAEARVDTCKGAGEGDAAC